MCTGVSLDDCWTISVAGGIATLRAPGQSDFLIPVLKLAELGRVGMRQHRAEKQRTQPTTFWLGAHGQEA